MLLHLLTQQTLKWERFYSKKVLVEDRTRGTWEFDLQRRVSLSRCKADLRPVCVCVRVCVCVLDSDRERER